MRFNRFAVLSVLAAGALALGGCNNADKTDDKASAGMVGNKEGCSKGGACCKSGEKANMGAVSEKKTGCCAGGEKASMGAVSEKKAGSCAGGEKAACPATKN